MGIPNKSFRHFLSLFMAAAILAGAAASAGGAEQSGAAAGPSSGSHYSGPKKPTAPDPREATVAGHVIEDAEVDDYAGRHNVSASVARRAIALQARVSELHRRASEEFPETFGGLWMEPGAHERVVVAFTRDAEASVSQLRQRFFRPETLTAHQVVYSSRQLRQWSGQLLDEFEQLRDRGVTGWGVQERLNAIRVHVHEASPEAERAIRQKLGAQVPLHVVVAGRPANRSIPPSNLACEVPYHSCNPIRGGTTLHLDGFGQDVADCTIGFNARRLTDSSPFFLTAGHCADTGYFHSLARVESGNILQSVSGCADAQRMAVRSGWSTSRWVIWSDELNTFIRHAFQIHDVFPGDGNCARRGAVGETVELCTTGAVYAPWGGTSCGPVVSGEWQVVGLTGGILTNQILFEGCGVGGDSGAPVFRADTAYGLQIGGYSLCLSFATYAVNAENATATRITIS